MGQLIFCPIIFEGQTAHVEIFAFPFRFAGLASTKTVEVKF